MYEKIAWRWILTTLHNPYNRFVIPFIGYHCFGGNTVSDCVKHFISNLFSVNQNWIEADFVLITNQIPIEWGLTVRFDNEAIHPTKRRVERNAKQFFTTYIILKAITTNERGMGGQERKQTLISITIK